MASHAKGPRTTLKVVLVVALLSGAILALVVWSLPVWAHTPQRLVACGMALKSHPGSGERMEGGEWPGDTNRQLSELCNHAGAANWNGGLLLLGAGVAIAAGCGVGLWLTRPRQEARSEI